MKLRSQVLMMRLSVIGVLLLFLSPLFAQEFRATLQGTIGDPHNAVVPGANVSLVNTATAVERKTVTDAEGYYLFQFLPPGTYLVTVQTARKSSGWSFGRWSTTW